MKEANLAREILLAASAAGHRLFLNVRGHGYMGEVVYQTPKRLTLNSYRHVSFGVGPNGASDLIGWTRDGLFAAIEVKSPKGAIRPDQPTFIRAVIEAGGRAGIVRTVDEALAVLDPSPRASV